LNPANVLVIEVICASEHVCIRGCVHVPLFARVLASECMYVCSLVCLHVRVCVCDVCVCVHVYACMRMCTCMCICASKRMRVRV